jgi:hypothetical protein
MMTVCPVGTLTPDAVATPATWLKWQSLQGLAQILGHESLNMTSIYAKRGEEQLQASVETMQYS